MMLISSSFWYKVLSIITGLTIIIKCGGSQLLLLWGLPHWMTVKRMVIALLACLRQVHTKTLKGRCRNTNVALYT